jgi:hypothetical protein
LASGSHHEAFPLVENPRGSLANRKTPGVTNCQTVNVKNTGHTMKSR